MSRERTPEQEVNAITDYITAETAMPSFFAYPRFLLEMELSHTAMLVYALLLDRTSLSRKNGWQDDKGRIYIVYPVAEIAGTLHKTTVTVQTALNELDKTGLVERRRRGFSVPNRLYVKLPQDIKDSLLMEQRNLYVVPKENLTDDIKKTLPTTQRKLNTNQLTINQLTENQTKRESGEPRAPYGEYQNIFLSETEYASLQAAYPDRLERLIEEMSGYVAASGKTYQNYAAALHRWAKKEKADKKGALKKGIPDYSFKEGESL